MKHHFNWKDASCEELSKHIAKVPASQTTSQLKYYSTSGDLEMVDKIRKARQDAKKWRLLFKAEQLGATIS